MATLHIRNVPADVVDVLKRRAQLSGRSLNGEVVHVLSQVEPWPARTVDDVLDSVRRRAERMNLPPEVAHEVVDDIRSARDAPATFAGGSGSERAADGG